MFVIPTDEFVLQFNKLSKILGHLKRQDHFSDKNNVKRFFNQILSKFNGWVHAIP